MRLNELQTDALAEVINIGMGRAALSLNELLGDHIELNVPHVEVLSPEELRQHLADQHNSLYTTVSQDFLESMQGRAMLAFPRASAVQLGRIVGGRESDDVEELNIDLCGIVEEVGNIVLNSVMGTIANIIGGSLSYSIPEIWTDVELSRITDALSVDGSAQTHVVFADASFSVAAQQITGSLILVFQMVEIQRIVDTMLLQTSHS